MLGFKFISLLGFWLTPFYTEGFAGLVWRLGISPLFGIFCYAMIHFTSRHFDCLKLIFLYTIQCVLVCHLHFYFCNKNLNLAC